MRRLLFGGGVLVALPLLLAACGLDQVEVPVETELAIVGQPFGSSAPLTSLGPLGALGSIDFGASDEFQAGGYASEDIESVKLVSMKLQVIEPAAPDGSIDFLNSVRFLANDTLEIASLDPVPDGQAAASLEASEAELVELAAGKTMTLSTQATGVPPRYDTRLRVKAVFLLDVAVF